MSTARLDPKFRQQLKADLEQHLYLTNDTRLRDKLTTIIHKNTTDAGYTHSSFTYKGSYYTVEWSQPRFKTNRLLPELHAEMDEYLAECRKIDYNERAYVIGFFTKVLNRTNSLTDMLRILPECVHFPIQKYLDAGMESLPSEMSDEQVEAFQQQNQDLIAKLKKRLVLDLITT